MRWTTKRKQDVHRWFAWHPVCIKGNYDPDGGNTYVWLQWVLRYQRTSSTGSVYHDYWLPEA